MAGASIEAPGAAHRLRSVIAVTLVVTFLGAPAVGRAADDRREPAQTQRREAPTYESPILSLLLLPVNLLIRMASVLEPEEGVRQADPNNRSR